MSTYRGPDGQFIGKDDRTTAGLIRRMVAKVTSGLAKWQVAGHKLLDKSVETRDPEVFQGVGFASRPRDGSNAETIVLFPGTDASNPVIVAARELGAFKAMFPGGIAADTTAILTSKACVLIKPDGTVEIRSATGTAVPLATKADIDTLKTWAASHLHGTPSGGGPSTTPTVAPPDAAGTTVLKGE